MLMRSFAEEAAERVQGWQAGASLVRLAHDFLEASTKKKEPLQLLLAWPSDNPVSARHRRDAGAYLAAQAGPDHRNRHCLRWVTDPQRVDLGHA
jgi:hypothetical protein